MTAEQYEAWYHTPRGAWIGRVEARLLRGLLEPRPGDTLLDVGCGTGYFTRSLAADLAPQSVIGVDRHIAAVSFAAARGQADFLVADARRLPFPDRSFDLVMSVTALCFIADEREAVAEMLRVARRRVVLGLLNRQSLLWWQKGRGGGLGAYRGAHWHGPEEAIELFRGLHARQPTLQSAVFLPAGGGLSRALEPLLAAAFPRRGGFLAVAAEVA